MKLSLQQISDITVGAARVNQTGRGISFHRFTEKQEETYRTVSPNDFYRKALATAGIRLEFMTDSRQISLQAELSSGSSRQFAYHDIFANGTLVAHIGTPFADNAIVGGTYRLPDGMKTVQIYFPWSVASTLVYLELDDGSTITPVRKPRKMLMFGDSITHGYDATYPSHSYASLLADYLNADTRNKAIGGEKFFPALLEEPDDISPDYITVAYGTNDWSGRETEPLVSNMREFYRRLSQLYPEAKIFAISPIWRADEFTAKKPSGAFANVEKWIGETADELPNVTLISGYDLVPHDTSLYSDARLHPNDAGFAFYAERLAAKIRQLI